MTTYNNTAGETLFEFNDDTEYVGRVEFILYFTEPSFTDDLGEDYYDEPEVAILSVPELIILREALDKEIAKRV